MMLTIGREGRVAVVTVDNPPVNALSQALRQSLWDAVASLDAADEAAYGEERFGPIAFVVAVADADDGIARAAELAKRKGAITAALYDTDEEHILAAADAFARAGVNLSVNLTGNIFVNQSAAFSDFHVTGINPAGNASLTDVAFVAGRFARAMWRRPVAA